MQQLKQGDLFWGMDNSFVKQVMDEAEKVTFKEGETLFKEGEPADYMYVLIKGRIKLTLEDEKGSVIYVANEAGQVIGWSAVLDRDQYSASAKCADDSSMLKFEKKSFLEKLSEIPESEAILYKRLARMLGERLLSLYPSMA
ncbi:MAG: cyclic nucleotide-binding domain-containing protein [Desulfarculaceae bacterium]|nr:cyclic nucleotide-binding domain-containing protein [Desulfarculaceae bacterium]